MRQADMDMQEARRGVPQADKTLGIVSHLLAFCGYIFPFGNILGPLIVYLIKKDQSPFIRHHSSEALNFQISVMVYALISAILVLVWIGVLLLIVVAVLSIVLTIVAAIRASDGEHYRYPMTMRFVS